MTFELSRQMFENLPELPTSQLLKSQTNQTNGLGATQCWKAFLFMTNFYRTGGEGHRPRPPPPQDLLLTKLDLIMQEISVCLWTKYEHFDQAGPEILIFFCLSSISVIKI